MKILFTGGSSFTGYWFVKTLAEKGHDVTCTYTGQNLDSYQDVRRQRTEKLNKISKSLYGINFGDEKFIQLIEEQKFDLLCHHASYVQNYKDIKFDATFAVQNNTKNVYSVMEALSKSGCCHIIITGSVFEGGEGAGSQSLPHFSPYGLSKSLTAQVFEYYSSLFKINYHKFVIPNPFGPYEEPRFTGYLIGNWFKSETPKVNTPDYVRDNIPVSLLAGYYQYFCDNINKGIKNLSPSGIVSSQGVFTEIVAREFSKRLKLKCAFALAKQTDFSEPLTRINTDHIKEVTDNFSEEKFWDAFVEFYSKKFKE